MLARGEMLARRLATELGDGFQVSYYDIRVGEHRPIAT
jgi:hypothetical protein